MCNISLFFHFVNILLQNVCYFSDCPRNNNVNVRRTCYCRRANDERVLVVIVVVGGDDGGGSGELDRGQRYHRHRDRLARRQSVRAVVVAPAGVDCAVRAHDHGGHGRQPDRHMDRDDQQADAERHQLLPGEPVHSGRHGVHAQRVRQLQLHAHQQLVLRHGLLQDEPVRGRAVRVRQRVHSDGHIDRQVRYRRYSRLSFARSCGASPTGV